ncbi:MAG: bifunctional glutamate N-acetyltransferase/amino-acid acetyltransferase ArgJ [Planctomycetota bacterium]|jgi:glutamate N-acetyltransferase/amino-acid N-acetyltransferase
MTTPTASGTLDPAATPRVVTDAPPCPAGFRAAGTACGIKPGGAFDLGLILAEPAATAAAMFTRNRVRAAPIDLSADHLAATGGRSRALLISSGNANALTGTRGVADARRMALSVAAATGAMPGEVLVNSTGIIGVPLPADRIEDAVPGLVAAAGADGLGDFAEAIRTTDSHRKVAVARIGDAPDAPDAPIVVGVAKGSGMIHPDMATMIGVVLTDAAVEPLALRRALGRAVDASFHRISIDGDTSTNDAVFAMASGAAGPVTEDALAEAMTAVCRDLAEQIVRDGEGARRLVRVQVRSAASTADADRVARVVASSLLVRTAVAGGDPNWGRILAAAGRSGVPVDADAVRLRIGGVEVFADGAPRTDDPRDPGRRVAAAAAMAGDTVVIELDLGTDAGGESEFLTCDLTREYIRLNSEETT